MVELNQNELMEINGGVLPAIPLAAKVIIGVIGLVFTAGTVRGCESERREDGGN